MDYSSSIKRTLVSFFHFLVVAIWFLFIYFKVWEFARSAIYLRYVNVQTLSFIVYSALMILFPAAFIYSPRRSKKKLFAWIGFLTAAVLFIGATGDLITYKFFIDYTFIEGDAIFCNIILGIPNLLGTLLCYLLAVCYALFGVYLTKERYAAFFSYLLIFLLSFIPALTYSFLIWGGYPRQTWIEKAAFIVPFHLILLISLLLSLEPVVLWKERIR